jgi:hypothetical protein
MSDDPAQEERASQVTEEEVDAWFESEDDLPEIEPEHDDVVQRYSEAQLRIVRSNMDLSLHNLRQSLCDANYINLSPTYQRRHRWDTKKRSQLIESLLLNIPIPPIFLFENDYNQYEIMDGRQRLEAIKGFMDNSFPLRGMEYWPELDGARFNDLPPTIQRGLLRRTISAIVLLAETSRPEDSEIDVRMALFKRLNTGGVKLNPHELRNALYPSEFNEMLQRISRWDVFRDTWGIPRFTPEEDEAVPKAVQTNALYKTMADCELVLRFYAIRETVQEDLSGSLRRLLDKSMKRHAGDSPHVLESLEADYRRVLSSLFAAFGGRPFVLPQTNRPSRPAYDAMMVGTALTGVGALEGREAAVRQNFLAAAQNPDSYEVLVGRGNTVDAIKARVALAQQLISQ